MGIGVEDRELGGVCPVTGRSFGKVYRLLAAGALSGLLACSSLSPRLLFGGELEVTPRIDAVANQNSAVALSLLIVYDQKLLDQLLGLKARDWFAMRDQIKQEHPAGKGFDIWEWEWVPGQQVQPATLSFATGARAGVIFASYLSDGPHRVRIDPHQNIVIHLAEKDFSVELAQ
ncbi:MAG: hypothetical protein M3O15_08190 [Acidobacteriota bacterium]|nr:hypothetical protein [Acidobacteriota bacterium]